ncbi:methyltransferase, FxLD system [Amycolatopsis thermoflava]|uniref:methyltransferase, FxLD system n=1 Tax=Amycolatopsis thermoflava TaxID=84480 RepID=UPI003F4A3284
MSTPGHADADAARAAEDPAELRRAMIAELWQMGAIRSDRVAAVFDEVPRHLFAPEAPPAQAYNARDAVHVKRDERGVPISTVSSPQLQAGMLEQADIRSGMRALEIGSGGVNAAMMAWLAGPDGQVITVDIDSDVTERARRLLDAAGYERVKVILADAENGVAEFAPYDRIIVTVGAWDIPQAWVDQLTPEGRLVVPLRVRGLTRSLELVREGDHLVSRSAQICGFVAMQGIGAHHEQLVSLRGTDAVMRFDDGWPGEQTPDLDGVLDTPRAELWTGVRIGTAESFETLQLWLATVFPGFGKLRAEPSLRPVLADEGVVWFDSAVIEGDSIAYLTTRGVEPGIAEFGAHGFGPHADDLVAAFGEQIRSWDRDQRHGFGPIFGVWPPGTPDERLPHGLVVDKRHQRITISWPSPTGQEHQEVTEKE